MCDGLEWTGRKWSWLTLFQNFPGGSEERHKEASVWIIALQLGIKPDTSKM
jgi:hypothetical protein